MVGVVKLVNQETGVFIVEADDSFAVYETEDASDLEAGDVMEGDLLSPTCESVVNHSKDGEMDVVTGSSPGLTSAKSSCVCMPRMPGSMRCCLIAGRPTIPSRA